MRHLNKLYDAFTGNKDFAFGNQRKLNGLVLTLFPLGLSIGFHGTASAGEGICARVISDTKQISLPLI